MRIQSHLKAKTGRPRATRLGLRTNFVFAEYVGNFNPYYGQDFQIGKPAEEIHRKSVINVFLSVANLVTHIASTEIVGALGRSAAPSAEFLLAHPQSTDEGRGGGQRPQSREVYRPRLSRNLRQKDGFRY